MSRRKEIANWQKGRQRMGRRKGREWVEGKEENGQKERRRMGRRKYI